MSEQTPSPIDWAEVRRLANVSTDMAKLIIRAVNAATKKPSRHQSTKRKSNRPTR